MKKILSREWKQFVQHSEALTGIVPFDENRSGTKRHMEIALVIANAHYLLDPRHLNGPLTDKHQEWNKLLRSGTEGAMRGMVPDGPMVQRCMDDWTSEAQSGIKHFQAASADEQASFAWRMHDKLICIHGFKWGNGRVARLELNAIRRQFGLPVHVIRDDEADVYYHRLNEYRRMEFLPQLEKYKAAA